MRLTAAQAFSEARYFHHHGAWIRARRQGDCERARRHLYALRAHLDHLGWLASEYQVPGYGVRR